MAIEVFFDGGRKVNANINGFTIKTDQNLNAGGEGSAPEPFTLFLASIATCAGVYVQSFCTQRDIPTNEISLSMEYEVDPIAKMIALIRIDIHVPAGFPEKYEGAVINVAALCAVKRHLSDKIQSEIKVIRK
jgi:ribosomal protein S12 methylthiotransferase accessory factor